MPFSENEFLISQKVSWRKKRFSQITSLVCKTPVAHPGFSSGDGRFQIPVMSPSFLGREDRLSRSVVLEKKKMIIVFDILGTGFSWYPVILYIV